MRQKRSINRRYKHNINSRNRKKTKNHKQLIRYNSLKNNQIGGLFNHEITFKHDDKEHTIIKYTPTIIHKYIDNKKYRLDSNIELQTLDELINTLSKNSYLKSLLEYMIDNFVKDDLQTHFTYLFIKIIQKYLIDIYGNDPSKTHIDIRIIFLNLHHDTRENLHKIQNIILNGWCQQGICGQKKEIFTVNELIMIGLSFEQIKNLLKVSIGNTSMTSPRIIRNADTDTHNFMCDIDKRIVGLCSQYTNIDNIKEKIKYKNKTEFNAILNMDHVELQHMGITPYFLITETKFRVDELIKNNNFTINEIIENFEKEGRQYIDQMLPNDFNSYGFTPQQLSLSDELYKQFKYRIEQISGAGFTIDELKEAGFTIDETHIYSK